MKKTIITTLGLLGGFTFPTLGAEHAQMVGLNGFTTTPIFTVGEDFDGYFPPGVPDGMVAYDRGESVYLLVNHEFSPELGYPYDLGNGTMLPGARVTTFVIDKETRTITDAGLAYHTIYNRAGEVVDSPDDLVFGGLNRLCSANGVEAGESGFVDAIFFTGEEDDGGTEFALDISTGELWAAPALGVGAWESVCLLSIPSINETHVALLLGDDRPGAALFLYLGEKDTTPGAGFLERNGLASGSLYMWKSDDGATRPTDFSGSGSFRTGEFVEVTNFDPAMAGQPGFDDLGYATQENLDMQRAALGAFGFSRPEDLHTNPYNGSQVVFASTGGVLDLDATGPAYDTADIWGVTYLIDVKLSPDAIALDTPKANLRIIVDGDDGYDPDGPRVTFGSHPGVRNPDNLCWSLDHFAYVQEDRASGYHLFGDVDLPGEEASVWQIHPHSGARVRVAQMNRLATLPPGQQEGLFGGFLNLGRVLGVWESSGITDVSAQFGEEGGSLFLLNVQAHGTVGGAIASENLVEGGQILFLSKE